MQIGCFESHRKAWKRVVDEELRQAIIMEDDADVDLSAHMKEVAAFVSDAPPDWQMLYLGINNDQVLVSRTCLVNGPHLSMCLGAVQHQQNTMQTDYWLRAVAHPESIPPAACKMQQSTLGSRHCTSVW